MTFPPESLHTLPRYYTPQNNDLSPESPCILPYYFTLQNNYLSSWITLYFTPLVYSQK